MCIVAAQGVSFEVAHFVNYLIHHWAAFGDGWVASLGIEQYTPGKRNNAMRNTFLLLAALLARTADAASTGLSSLETGYTITKVRSSASVDVPCGLFRFIDIELREQLG